MRYTQLVSKIGQGFLAEQPDQRWKRYNDITIKKMGFARFSTKFLSLYRYIVSIVYPVPRPNSLCWVYLFLLLAWTVSAEMDPIFQDFDQKIVLATRKYEFAGFPEAFNPAIFQVENGYIMTFRYCPDEYNQHWLSLTGIVELDEELNPVGEPQILKTRSSQAKTPSQTEDVRIFSFRGQLYVIYHDNVDETYYNNRRRRDMFIAKLMHTKDGYEISQPLKLYHEEKYSQVHIQKNWLPFEWNQKLYITYSLWPHEILVPDLRTGACKRIYETCGSIHWPYGLLRGSAPPLLIDGEYLSFFHSGTVMNSPVSWGWNLWHYFAGAYTFSAEPPFKITKISKKPINYDNFYTLGNRWKRVIFPGGFVVKGPLIYMAYGKDDCEIWIATLDLNELKKSLVPVNYD